MEVVWGPYLVTRSDPNMSKLSPMAAKMAFLASILGTKRDMTLKP